MGSENDIESFIRLQKEKLASERDTLHPKADYDLENRNKQTLHQNGSFDEKQRKQWQAPSKPDINQNDQPPSSVQFGAYEQQRRQLDEERKHEYNEMMSRKQTSNNNRQPSDDQGGMFSTLGQHENKRKALNSERNQEYNKLKNENTPDNRRQTQNEEEGGIFSKLGQYEAKRKVLDVERHNEYNKKISEAAFRSTGKQSSFAEPSLPGLRDHPSADQLKMKQRNAEYNEFLRMQEDKRSSRFADKKGLPVQPAPQPDPYRGEQRQQQRRQPADESNTPRRGWATPSYDELLDEKRRQEQSYRRRNDPEADTRRTYPTSNRETDERFEELDRQYEKRKVKFANDRNRVDDSTDIYDWEYSKQGRSRSFYREPDPKPVLDPYERARSVPPKEEQMTGLAIGHSETNSAARRRKDQYRHELEQQITSDHRGKSNKIGGFSRENDYPSNSFNNPLSQPAYQTPRPTYSDQSRPMLDDRRPLASILNERRDLVDTAPHGNAVRFGLQPGLLEKGFSGLYEPSVLSQQRQQPPLYGYNQQPYNGQPYQTPADPAYNYYAVQDPLASFTAPPLGLPQYPQQQQQQPIQIQQTPRQQPTNPYNSTAKPQVAVGAFPSERTDKGQLKKDNQLTYQQELKRQMEEKQAIQARKKAEQEAYDRKLNEEIANYNPFGKGGAGAPMKDGTGNVVADLRSMKAANNGQTPRPEVQQQAPAAAATTTPRFEPTLPNLNLSGGAGVLDDNVGHARGGHGIFGEPKTDVQKTAADRYKEELQIQINEKKRLAELEKQKLKDEEEREMKRLEEDRIKIQKEFEAEQAKAKAKEEETRRKNEEMKQAAEEKRKLAEQQREAADEKRRKRDDEHREKERQEREDEEKRQREKKNNTSGPRAESPPIPTMRSKTQPPGSMEVREPSPPLPTQRSKTQHDQALPNSKPVVQDAEPSTSRAAPPHSATRPESRAQSAEVLNQLAHMRQQLQQERARVENALTKQKLDVDVYDPRTGRTEPRDVDVFEIARSRKPVSARRTRNEDSDEQLQLPKPSTATSLLQSDSAFIDDSGIRAAFPDDFDALATNQNARRRRREKLKPQQPEVIFEDEKDGISLYSQRDNESVVSVDPDRITRKNQDRLRKLKAIAGDDISLDDPDDIIDRFMTKQNHNRPPSGQTLTDETWMNSNR